MTRYQKLILTELELQDLCLAAVQDGVRLMVEQYHTPAGLPGRTVVLAAQQRARQIWIDEFESGREDDSECVGRSRAGMEGAHPS